MFKLPLKLDAEAYKNDIVIHDGQWSRVAAFPKNEQGMLRAKQLCTAVNAYEELLKRLTSFVNLFDCATDSITVGPFAKEYVRETQNFIKGLG